MNMRKGMQLSMNVVVMAVLAFVFLGIAIAFITGVFDKLEDAVPIPDPVPICDLSANNPVCLRTTEIEIDRGENAIFPVQSMNFLTESALCELSVTTEQEGITFVYPQSNVELDPLQAGEWQVAAQVSKTTPPGIYSVDVVVMCGDDSNSKNFFISIE